MLYFAYGSNMSSRRLQARVASATVYCCAALPEHDLRFHKVSEDGSGKCDVVAQAGAIVHGVVYRIDPEERETLDRFEGLGQGYEAIRLGVTTETGNSLEVFFYQATHTDPLLQPYDWYLMHVVHGAAEHNLPPDYQRRLSAIPSLTDPESERHAREVAIYI